MQWHLQFTQGMESQYIYRYTHTHTHLFICLFINIHIYIHKVIYLHDDNYDLQKDWNHNTWKPFSFPSLLVSCSLFPLRQIQLLVDSCHLYVSLSIFEYCLSPLLIVHKLFFPHISLWYKILKSFLNSYTITLLFLFFILSFFFLASRALYQPSACR